MTAPRTEQSPSVTQQDETGGNDRGQQFLLAVTLLAQHAEKRSEDWRSWGAQRRPDSESGGTPPTEWWSRYWEWRNCEQQHRTWWQLPEL